MARGEMGLAKPRGRGVYLVLALLTMLCGMAVYPLFRGPNLLLWSVVPRPGFWEMWRMPYPKEGIAAVLVGSGPDLLWFLSGILLLRFIWFYRIKTQRAYVLCFYGIGFIFEMSQLSEKVPGTFDLMDLFFMGMGAFTEALLHKFFVKRGRERKR